MEKTTQSAVAPQNDEVPSPQAPTVAAKEVKGLDNKSNDVENGVVNRLLRWAAYPVAAAAGWATTYISVRDTAYRGARENNPVFDELKNTFNETNKENLLRVKGQHPDGKTITKSEFVNQREAARKTLSSGVQTEMEAMELGTFRQKWRNINLGNKTKALIEGGTVAGIAIGAILTVAQSRTLSRLFAHDKEPDR